jgi:hypothetical protein
MIPHGAEVRKLTAIFLLSATLTALHAAVDVSAVAFVRPRDYELEYWRFSPAAVVGCHGEDSATLSAWFTMFGRDGQMMYRDSLASVVLAPGDDTLLTFAQYEMGGNGGYWTARCSVAAIGDTYPTNDVITKRFAVGGPG